MNDPLLAHWPLVLGFVLSLAVYLKPVFFIALGLFGVGYFGSRLINGRGDRLGTLPLLIPCGFAIFGYGVLLLFECILNRC